MKKWCYIGFNIESSGLGVKKKIIAQSNALKKYVEKCDTIFCFEDKFEVYEKEQVFEQNELLDFLLDYDVIYMRWAGFDATFLRVMKDVCRGSQKVIIEIPTYPVKGELWGKARARIKNKDFIGAIKSFVGGIVLQDFLINRQKKQADLIVFTSKDAKIKKAEYVNICNGIEPSAVKVRNYSCNQDSVNLLVVANLSLWHGVDRVIRGISEYSGNTRVVLWVVGDGNEKQNLMLLTSKFGIEENVKFVGQKHGKELDEYFDSCDVAVGSLGLHRLNIKPSSLKSREYMARGIPFLTTKEEDIEMNDNIFPYIEFIDANESAVNIEKVVSWKKQIDYERASVVLREHAEKVCSWHVQMKKVVDRVNTI